MALTPAACIAWFCSTQVKCCRLRSRLLRTRRSTSILRPGRWWMGHRPWRVQRTEKWAKHVRWLWRSHCLTMTRSEGAFEPAVQDVVAPGRSAPLGAEVSPGGVNFSVYSRNASRIELVFFDHDD